MREAEYDTHFVFVWKGIRDFSIGGVDDVSDLKFTQNVFVGGCCHV
jgi:hypothetical protein